MQFILTLFAALATVAFSLTPAMVRGEEPAAPSSAPSVSAPQVAVDDAPVQTPDNQTIISPAPGASGDKWRFRQHQGLWWYWLPSNSWVYWHDGKWTPYDAASYTALRQTMPIRQQTYYRGRNSRGSDGYPELGEWGRVRYDGYGNRQYPYSMRRSGIKQLGPVPAMGGVRSLPGWGGER